MKNYCIKKSKVSSQMCIARLMDDACFNNIKDETFHLHKALLWFYMPYGFLKESVNFLKIATSLLNLVTVQ